MTKCARLSRRRFSLAAAVGAAFAGACGTAERRSRWLRYILGGEPDTLDPAKSMGGSEGWIISALFEPLVQAHPETMTPIAGLATHYEVARDGTRYTFYLRGHPAPEGIRLPRTDSVPVEFSRKLAARPDNVPARWSDGTPITAYDVVYSWRRYVAPETGNSFAYPLYCVAGAEAISSRKVPPQELGVRALDPFTFQLDLRAPAPHLLMVCYCSFTLPLPRHAIEAARNRGHEASWTEPGHIVTSGPFLLKESRPHERIVVAKNPNYFDAAFVGVEEIQFCPADGVVALNLFQAGLADSMDGRVLPLQLAPSMRNVGLHVRSAYASHTWRINAKRPPLDNLFLRYALNMATDKEATTRFVGAGQIPAKSRVPAINAYASPQNLPIEINGRNYDVLAYDPRAARDLWARAASSMTLLPVQIHYPARTSSQSLAEILQYQWRSNLGLETRLIPHENPRAYAETILQGADWTGVAEDPYIANYPDPSDLLALYTANYPSWSDSEFDGMLAIASAVMNPALRMEKLAKCESKLLRAMPFIPLYFDTWVYLERPEIHGLSLNPGGVPVFKYAWIDTNRRLQ